MNKIIFVNTLNNFSGSPKMLSIIVQRFVEWGYDIKLITSRGPGFLSGIKGVSYIYNNYRWYDNKWRGLLSLAFDQVWLFFKILQLPGRDTLYYINTITPVGAVWACKLSCKKMVYHVHEDMQQRKPLYGLYRMTYKCCNRRSIFVSKYLQSRALECHSFKTIPNCLDNNFINIAREYLQSHPANAEMTRQDILMVASLRRFKGVYEFVTLSKQLPQYHFVLVLSASQQQVDLFTAEIAPPNNLNIYSIQTNLHPFYQRAKLLLQLTRPDQCIETFGLTILEAMVYGVPAIGPNVGGPVELIDDDVNGYTLDPRNLDSVREKIVQLMTNDVLYHDFSTAAQKKAALFISEVMFAEIENYINR